MANTGDNNKSAGRRRKRCRIWWPEQQQRRRHPPDPHALLFGWCFRAASPEYSLDLVVALRVPSGAIASSSFARFDDLQETLISINRRLPCRLQDKALFTLIGCCTISDATFASEQRQNGDVKEGWSDFQRSILINGGIWVDMLLSEPKSAFFSKEGIRTVPVVRSLLVGPISFENCDCHVCYTL